MCVLGYCYEHYLLIEFVIKIQLIIYFRKITVMEICQTFLYESLAPYDRERWLLFGSSTKICVLSKFVLDYYYEHSTPVDFGIENWYIVSRDTISVMEIHRTFLSKSLTSQGCERRILC